MQTIIYRIDKQRDPIRHHRELYSIFCDNIGIMEAIMAIMETIMEKNICIYN